MELYDLEFEVDDFKHVFGFKSLRREMDAAKKATERANIILKRKWDLAQVSTRSFQNELARRMADLDLGREPLK